MAAKAEKNAMPRRLAEDIELESVNKKYFNFVKS
jgi:hypothetical protein